MPSKPLIPDDLVPEFERGLSIAIGTRDGELQADGCSAWAARVHDDREQLTVFLYEAAAPAMLRNLEQHPEIAVLLERPSLQRGWQVKGRFVSARPARDDERADVERQAHGFRAELQAIGIPGELTAAWSLWPCVAITLRAERLFEQAPGPGSGEPLR
ncbi:MAG: hypothetical protein NDJ94_19230 [Vicinamibacteria bacterium]|nr:hypothetical protein [Vicinamibacteria bacterium]